MRLKRQRYRPRLGVLGATVTSPEDRAYVAGFVDGEGCLSVRWNRDSNVGLYITANVTNTCLPILQALRETWGGNILTIRNTEPSRWRQKYRWEVGGRYAARLLREILPHLRIKDEQAKLLLSFRAGDADAGEVFAKIRSLNKRGPREVAAS